MSDEADNEVETDDDVITCWCGATGTCEELFDTACLDRTCGGLGTLNCYCGGDLCVCHHHGSIDCDGCEDCESEDDYDNDGFEDGFDDE